MRGNQNAAAHNLSIVIGSGGYICMPVDTEVGGRIVEPVQIKAPEPCQSGEFEKDDIWSSHSSMVT